MFRRVAVFGGSCLCLLLLAAVAGCGTATLIADDAVVLDSRPTPLNAYVGNKDLFSLRNDIRKASVTFDVNGRRIGQEAIDETGRASVVFQGPPGVPASFHASSRVRGRTLDGRGRIFHWRQGRVILAVDLDYCIVKTNYVRLLFGKHIPVSPPFPGAREVLAELSTDYQILYLTARPRPMLDRTRDWLDHYGFPSGPVIVSDRFRDVMRQPEWKSDILEQLQRQYPSLLISVGNRKLDIDSAMRNDILPLIVQSSEMDAKDGTGNVILEDWRAVSEFFRVNRQALIDPFRLNRSIHQGVTLLQPMVDPEGRYRYQPKQLGPPSRAVTGSAAATR